MGEVIEARRWKHTGNAANPATGRTASVSGAVPWVSENDRSAWTLEVVGFTIKHLDGTTGLGRRLSKRERRRRPGSTRTPISGGCSRTNQGAGLRVGALSLRGEIWLTVSRYSLRLTAGSLALTLMVWPAPVNLNGLPGCG